MSDITELVAFVREASALGLNEHKIIEQLLNAGWQKDEILTAFARALVSFSHSHRQELFESPSIIEVKNLSKRYGNFTAVDSISFNVLRGETFGILGPSGAGKTTTLEMIEGLKRPSDGLIFVDGIDSIKEAESVKRIIGVQLQASTFFEGLKLHELLSLFGSLYEKKINPVELLLEVQLTEKANSQVKELSGGQKQRFSIAVGLVNTPKVLFLDEPTTGLDPQARRNLWDLVNKIKLRGTTIVLTTHYMDEAEILCDRIAIMDNAKIIALDTTMNLLEKTGSKNIEEVFLKLTGHELRE